jgi:hypothetical protein
MDGPRRERPETRDRRPETGDQRPETRDQRPEIEDWRSQIVRFPLSSLPFKNQPSSFDIRSNHWNPMVGRTGPVSRGFRLRRPTRLREAASPYRSWMTDRFKPNPTKSCFVPRHSDRRSDSRDRRTEVEVRNSPAFPPSIQKSTILIRHSNRPPSALRPSGVHGSPCR